MEEKIIGAEITAGILERDTIEALPVIEIKTPPGSWYDFEHRYTPGLSEHVLPAPLPEAAIPAGAGSGYPGSSGFRLPGFIACRLCRPKTGRTHFAGGQHAPGNDSHQPVPGRRPGSWPLLPCSGQFAGGTRVRKAGGPGPPGDTAIKLNRHCERERSNPVQNFYKVRTGLLRSRSQ